MEKERYETLRHDLTREVARLLSIRCKLSAKARIRKIAQLDFEERGIDIEETKRNFKYYEI